MEDQINQNVETTDDEKSKSITLMIVGVVILFIAFIGGYLLISRDKNKASMTSINNVQTSPTTMPETETEDQGVTLNENEITQGGQEAVVEDGSVIELEGGSFYFKPNIIKAKVGQTVKIKFTSVGGMPHDFVIDELEVDTEEIVDDTLEVDFVADKAGSFEFYCSVGNHRRMGMKGTLIVE